MFKLALASLAFAVISIFIGETGFMPVELGRTLFGILFVIGGACFALGLITQVDVPKDPPPFDSPPKEEKTDPRHPRQTG